MNGFCGLLWEALCCSHGALVS